MLKNRLMPKTLFRKKQIENFSSFLFPNMRWNTTFSADKESFFDETSLAASKPFEEMPCMAILPWIGSAWIYLPIIGRFDFRKQHIVMIQKRKILGDIFRERFGKLNIVFTFNADDMQTLFKNEGPYPVRNELASIKAYRESRKQWYKNPGLMVLQGKEWHDLRTKTQKHLMKPRAVQAYLNPMQDVARDLVEKMYKCRDSNKEVPDFLGELYKWALESIGVIGLDTRLGCLKTDLPADSDGIKMINSAQTILDLLFKFEPMVGNLQLWKYFPTPMWKRFTAAGDVFTEISFKYINRALEELKTRTESDDKDLTLLQSMLMTKGLNFSGAIVMVSDMLLAGIDTTSHTVGFFLCHMARNPEKQELLYQEIKNLLPRKEERITPAVFNELKYLKACMKESQRLDPVAGGTARTIDHDVVISGYRVPAETFIVVGLQTMYRDEKYFPNPDKYLPERWLKKDKTFHPFSYLPFGIGTRSCIGRRLAELEIMCLITEIIRNFRIEYHHEDIGMFTRAVNAPDKPLRYNFLER